MSMPVKVYNAVRELLLSDEAYNLSLRQVHWLDRALCRLSDREFIQLLINLDEDFVGNESDPWTYWEKSQLVTCTGKIIAKCT